MSRRLEIWVLGCSALGLLGCGGAGQRGADSSTAGSSTGVATDVGSSTSASGSTTTGTSDTHGATSIDPSDMTFLITPELVISDDCDPYDQDCPRGEKCTVWASDGGIFVNSTKCVPVSDDPRGTGEPCHVEGSLHSGIDDCDFGAVCWHVDPETLDGACVPFCVRDGGWPTCEEPGWICPNEDSPVPVCFQLCNPSTQDCPEGQGCYPLQGEWVCTLDASNGTGAYGDRCGLLNQCDPGLVCVNPERLPPGQECEDAVGCCTELCDLTDPAGDLQCSGAAEGQTCQPWDEEAEPSYENVGVCVLPA